MVKAGQVYEDTYNYGPQMKERPTLTITKSDGKPGGFACGIRQPSGRKTRLRLNSKGELNGYRLTK